VSAPRKRARRKSRGKPTTTPESPALSGPVLYALAFAGFLGALLIVYAPALDGEFISDDSHYVSQNPYLQDLDAQKLVAILDPTSVVARHVENYAPLHLLLHAAERSVFGGWLRGYHVVNLVMHAAASLLLALFFQRNGASQTLAFAGAALFLLHPANVEAVAWISQLKTTTAMVLALLALLAHPRRPALGMLAFGLALLAKPTAAVALFVAAVLTWVRGGREQHSEGRAAWLWLAVWAGVLGLFAIAEFSAFNQTAGQAPPFYPELDVRMRTISAIALRYLVLAATGLGTSVFHEPPAAESWLDPVWLASLVVLGLLAWRLAISFRRRSVEAAYWCFALVSFAPICGVIPLPFPMADRYLYFILPGLIGAMLVAGPELRERLPTGVRELAPKLCAAACAAMLLVFASQSHTRAGVFQTGNHFMLDAEMNYPEGAAAMTRQAHRAAEIGDVDGAVAALRAAMARGYNRLDHVLGDPAYQPYLDDPRFRPIVVDLANEWLSRLGRTKEPSQMELRVIAQAHIVLGDLPAAERALRQAKKVGGPLDERVRFDLEMLERQKRFQRARKPR
jgi:hypothetical protein